MKHGIVFCCAVFAAFSAAAQAVPLIYDGFNYPLGEPLAGQQSPDVGWAGAWDVNSATANAVVVAGLTFAGPRYDLFVSGNAVKLSAWQSESLASRGVSASVVGGDLWTGWLVNVDGVIAGNRVVESRVNLFEFGDFRASKLRTLIKSFFGTGPAVAYGIHEALGTPDTTQPNTTYLLVSHFEDVNQYQGGPATLWMVSLADFSAMDLADGVMSVADLEAHHSCKVVCDH